MEEKSKRRLLTKEDWQATRLLSGKGMTNREVGEVLGFSGASVSRLSRCETWREYLDYLEEVKVKHRERALKNANGVGNTEAKTPGGAGGGPVPVNVKKENDNTILKSLMAMEKSLSRLVELEEQKIRERKEYRERKKAFGRFLNR